MIKNSIQWFSISGRAIAIACLAVIVSVIASQLSHASAASQTSGDKKLVTIHDRGEEKVILTEAKTVSDALKDSHITLDENDAVEPNVDEELIDSSYYVNIYRARPVVVTDGAVKQKIMTPYQTADKIAADADITLHDEDTTSLKLAEDIVSDGAGLELQIDRATPFTLVLYGSKSESYTQQTTVKDMLQQKNITLAATDHVSVPLEAPIVPGMTVMLSRDGKQTVTADQEIPFTSEKVYDTARPIGFKEIQTPGVAGKRTVTYEVEMLGGREISRKEIQNVVTLEPKKQVEIIGIKTGNGLSRSKGANMFTDSKGIVHRETYYDLAMNVVMRSCGGGEYTVRPDGAKIDKDGYILIAANLGNYPRCSIVETSMGLGKVYDTGGFAARHPHGYDLATDWTDDNGR